jgi:hypothetical protein
MAQLQIAANPTQKTRIATLEKGADCRSAFQSTPQEWKRAREDMMTGKTLGRRALVLGGLAALLAMRPADAAPPTVVPSPGYDARLREERSARVAPPPGIVLPTPLPRPRPHRHRHPRRAIDRFY